MKKLALVFTAVATLAGFTAAEANAQLPHSWSASCVGGAIGCSQVDFFIELLDGGSSDIDYFWVAITSPGWSFLSPFWGGESEDAYGDPGFLPESVSSDRIEGSFFGAFDPFVAFLDPDFRFRAEMATYEADISSFSFDCEGSLAGDVVFDCEGGEPPPPPVTTPEPGTALLLAGGLAGMLGVARRRRRDEV